MLKQRCVMYGKYSTRGGQYSIRQNQVLYLTRDPTLSTVFLYTPRVNNALTDLFLYVRRISSSSSDIWIQNGCVLANTVQWESLAGRMFGELTPFKRLAKKSLAN